MTETLYKRVTDVTEYANSSARFYLDGEHAAYTVMNFMELDDLDLTKAITD